MIKIYRKLRNRADSPIYVITAKGRASLADFIINYDGYIKPKDRRNITRILRRGFYYAADLNPVILAGAIYKVIKENQLSILDQSQR